MGREQELSKQEALKQFSPDTEKVSNTYPYSNPSEYDHMA